MNPALALQLIAALLTDLPEIVKDVESLVSALKGHSAPSAEPITPGIVTADTTLDNKLPQS